MRRADSDSGSSTATSGSEVRGALYDELEPAFRAMAKLGMQAVLTNADGLSYAQRGYIAELALKARLPAMVWGRETLVPGALFSYGAADTLATCRRAAV